MDGNSSRDSEIEKAIVWKDELYICLCHGDEVMDIDRFVMEKGI